MDNVVSVDDRLLESDYIQEAIASMQNKDSFATYVYGDRSVPRVSNIFKRCIGNEGLLYWAAKLGTKNMYVEKKKATTIGSVVHEMIEYNLLNNKDMDPADSEYGASIYFDDLRSIMNAYGNYKRWRSDLELNGNHIDRIIFTEKPVVCPFFGGTIDLVAVINGGVYIVDWKTSKQISTQYIMQVCAYRWMVNNGYCPELAHVDGIGIVRLDKSKTSYEEFFLNENIPYQNEQLYQYTAAFGSLLNEYYNLLNTDYLYNNYKYSLGDVISYLEDN